MTTTHLGNPLLNERSLPYRKVSTFCAQLRLLDRENERLHVVSRLTDNEWQVARKVHEFECNQLGLQPKSQLSSFNVRASAPLRAAARNGQLENLMLLMQQSGNKVQCALQEKALGLLWKENCQNPQSKSPLVNYGVLVAIVDAMKRFPTHPEIQRKGTTLLMALMNDHVGTTDRQGEMMKRLPPHQGIDLGILCIVQELGGFDWLVEAMNRNLYQVQCLANTDFIRASAGRLAASQILLVIRQVEALLRTCRRGHAAADDEDSRKDFFLLRKKCVFLRQCYATLLEDKNKGTTQSNMASYIYACLR